MQTTGRSGSAEVAQIAGRFNDLLGLRQAVGGVAFLIIFVWTLAFPVTLSDIHSRAAFQRFLWGGAVVTVAALVFIAGSLWMSAWYRRHYGRVVRNRGQNRLGVLLGVGGFLAFIVPFETELIASNTSHPVAFNLWMFTFAIWIAGYWLYLGRSYVHYALFAAVALALGIVSTFGVPPLTFVWHLREVTLFFAFASIVGGAIDHRTLTRAMPGRSVAGTA